MPAIPVSRLPAPETSTSTICHERAVSAAGTSAVTSSTRRPSSVNVTSSGCADAWSDSISFVVVPSGWSNRTHISP
jgi:hypothetical protein